MKVELLLPTVLAVPARNMFLGLSDKKLQVANRYGSINARTGRSSNDCYELLFEPDKVLILAAAGDGAINLLPYNGKSASRFWEELLKEKGSKHIIKDCPRY